MAMNEISNKAVRKTLSSVAWLIAACALIMIVSLDGCTSKPNSYSEFKEVPLEGWHLKTPLSFTPQYGDSSCLFDVKLVVRHTSQYKFQNLSMIVDAVDSSHNVHREKVDMVLADSYGNWAGSGFGTLYQREVTAFRALRPEEAKHIVVWQRMPNCSFVKGLQEVGVIVVPEQK